MNGKRKMSPDTIAAVRDVRDEVALYCDSYYHGIPLTWSMSDRQRVLSTIPAEAWEWRLNPHYPIVSQWSWRERIDLWLAKWK